MTFGPDHAHSLPNDPDTTLRTLIGRRIRTARTDRGFTQKALGGLAGVHEVHISRLEAGTLDTRLSTLRKIAGALDLPLSELLSSAPDMRS